jgi:O-antigen/teichoic acid export membrane protein
MPDPAETHAEGLRRARVITRNVAYNFGAQVWFLALAVVTTPYLVGELGIELYGLLALLTSLMGYFAFLDLGLGVATVKYLSEFHARGDEAAVRRVVGTSIGAFLVLGVLGGGAIAAAAPFLAETVLDLQASRADLARTALYVAALGFLVNMPLAAFGAIPNALQWLDLVNRRSLVFGTASVAGTVSLLALGRGLVAVLVLNALVSLAAAGSFARLARRLLPTVSLWPRLDLPTLRLLTGFGSLKFANQLATQTVYHIDRFLVGALVSVSAVTYYAIPATIAQRLAALVANISGAYLPAASDLHGRDDRRRFAELYFRATKLVAVVVFPIGSLAFIFAEPVLRFWLGARFAAESADVLRVLVAGYMVNALSTIPAVAADSLGRPRVTTAFSVASGALNVGLSVVLIPAYGIMGAAVAILANSLLLVPLFLVYVHRRVLFLGIRELMGRSLLRPFAATVAAWPPMLVLAHASDSVPVLLVALAAGLLAYLASTVAFRVYDAVDRDVARSYLRRAAPGSTG